MKPGNLLVQGAKSGGKTRDEDSIFTHIESVGVRFFLFDQHQKILAAAAADLLPRLRTAGTSKYTKYSFGTCGLIRERISRCAADKSFLILVICESL